MKLFNQVGKFSCYIINEQPQHFIEFSYTILYYISHFSNENIQHKTENVKCNIFFCNFKGVTFKKDEKEENNTKKLQKC